MKALSPTDQLFLWLERRNQPMHVGGLLLARPPRDAGPDYLERLGESLRAATFAHPPYDQQLVRKYGAWFWEKDEHFDVDHHFRHLALPKPGRVRELLRIVSQLHAAPLDRARPLWETYLIDGVEGGRFAMYSKIHHAVVDGIAALRLLSHAMSEDEDERDRPPPWAIPPRARPPRPLAGAQGLDGGEDEDAAHGFGLRELMGLAGKEIASVRRVTRELARTIREVRSGDDVTASFRAPPCILNQAITGSRRFAAQSWSLTRIRAAAKAHHATLNDVVLAMCAGALRRYLLDLDALPDKPLIAMVPVSLRRDESASGNQVAMILANLATHLVDPGERLATIKASVAHAKERYASMSPNEILVYAGALLGPAGLNFLTGAAPKVQAFNVIISNVPGPKRPLFFNGARIEGMYPVSIVVDGQALNMTLTSYVDAVEFGIIACRRTLPRIQRLLDHLEVSLRELEGVSDALDLP